MRYIKEFKQFEKVSNDEIIEFCKKYKIKYEINKNGEIYVDGDLVLKDND